MNDYNFYSSFGIKDKFSGFYWTIDALKKDKTHVCVLIGIYKRWYFNLNKHCWNLGFIYIGHENIAKIFFNK